jgi:hypothetical protein
VTGKQRISYVAPESVDDDMRAELERCARYGTPRPESQSVRAHVPAVFWSFANSWQVVFRDGETAAALVASTARDDYWAKR